MVMAAAFALGLAVALCGQNSPTLQPPAQRPPGASPASQVPPHPPAHTAPETVNSLPGYEGQNVASVELAGWPGLDAAPLIAQLPQKVGQSFDRAAVEASITKLQQLLRSRAAPNGAALQGVQLQVEPEPDGVRILFILAPAEYFGIYHFPGALVYPYTRLLEAANYQSRQPYTAGDLTAAQSGLVAFFQHQGYFEARVETVLHADAKHGLVSVDFRTTLGPRAKFGAVTFQGVVPAEADQLHRVLNSIWARVKRTAVRTGHGYDVGTLDSASSYLQSHLNGQGYLAAQVSLAAARYHPATRRADIVFNVHTGPKINVSIEGAHFWPWTRHSLLPIYQESRVDAELIQEGQDNLANYLSSHGYFSAKVTTTVTRANGNRTVTSISAAESAAAAAAAAAVTPTATAPSTNTASIVYAVDKGPRHDVEKITFSGNNFYSDDELLAQVTLQPEGFPFSHGSFSAPLLQQSVNNIKALYQASGYSSVDVTPQISHPGGNLAVKFQIREGPQDYVTALHIVGNTVNAALLAPNGLLIGPGTPFSQKLIAEDRAQILAHYLSLGYLNATLHATATLAKGQPHELEVTYAINEGPQVRTATVTTVGRQVTVQRFVDRQTQDLKPETYLTENDMLTAESQLYAPGIFDWAEVGPRRPITTQSQEDVVIKVHEAKRNTLVYGFGFDLTNRGGSIPSGTVALPGLPVVGLPNNFKTSQATYYGPSVNLQYTRINLRGKAESISIGGFAGRLDQRAAATYTNPALLWSNFSGNLDLSAEYDAENPIFTSRQGQVGYQLERALNPDRTTNLFLRYTFSQTALTRLLIPDLVPVRDRNIRLSTLSASFVRDTRDNPLDAHKGLLESYELDLNSRALGSSVDFAKMVTQMAYYRRLAGNVIWANSVRFGFDHALANSFVPISQSFFSGGGSTLRGFPLDGAGPQNTIPACGNPSDPSTCSLIRVPVGGNALFIINTELRIPTPKIWNGLGVAVFYDGGNVFSHLGFNNLGANFSNTLGVGLRYDTPVGPIRIDVGQNLNPIPGIKATQIFITLGQAF